MLPEPNPATRTVLAPTQLNTLARELLEGAFGTVWVEGELGGISRPSSGHLYFVLKDARAQVRCALFRPKSQWLKFRPVDGMAVLARGRITLYEARGDYQLIVEHMEEAGEGALRRAFEELKARLQAEGLFDPARKRSLPGRIARIGLLSSPGGAAVHDVLTVLRRRFPLLQVDLLPVPVQGTQAAAEIVRMLERADQSERYDILLLTRGGGSLEDLAAFNDEALARAIAACRTVVVSAIGHEIDFSISDFVADLRAATPTAAAELLSPDGPALLRSLLRLRAQLGSAMQRADERGWLRLDPLQHRLSAQAPATRLKRGRVQLADLLRRLGQTSSQGLERRRSASLQLAARLSTRHPRLQLEQLGQRNRLALQRLQAAILRRLGQSRSHTTALARTLRAIGPLATLERGYAIVLSEDGGTIRHAEALAPGQRVSARFVDGHRALRVEPDASGD